jgi:hypothetical protein
MRIQRSSWVIYAIAKDGSIIRAAPKKIQSWPDYKQKKRKKIRGRVVRQKHPATISETDMQQCAGVRLGYHTTGPPQHFSLSSWIMAYLALCQPPE